MNAISIIYRYKKIKEMSPEERKKASRPCGGQGGREEGGAGVVSFSSEAVGSLA